MKLLAFVPRAAHAARSSAARVGLQADDGIIDLTSDGIGDLATLIGDGAAGLERVHAFGMAVGRQLIDPLTVELRAPLPRPGKVVCIGLNYHDHCFEQKVDPPDYPMIFAKFANAVTDPGAPVRRPIATEKLDLECELAVVIGERASHIRREDAMDAVWGFTILNDVTMRDLQREDRQWLRAKGSDGFAPMGPVVVTRDEIPDPHRLGMRSSVNGETWQDSSTDQMVFDVPTLVAFVSRTITLEPGDVIATGTPAGVGHFHAPPRYVVGGDVMRCEIEGIGVLENPVVDEEPRIADHLAAAGVTELVAEVPA